MHAAPRRITRPARDGTALFVKALGDDERSADVMFRVYRRLQPRDLGDEKAFSTLRRAVEHEALVALGGPRPRHPHAAPRGVRDRAAQRLRARVRGHRRSFPGPRRARRADRRGDGGRVVATRRSCAPTASPIATCASPTCSWPTTAPPGSSTSASASWRLPISCWPPTSPSCSPRRRRRSAPTGPSPPGWPRSAPRR